MTNDRLLGYLEASMHTAYCSLQDCHHALLRLGMHDLDREVVGMSSRIYEAATDLFYRKGSE